MELTLNQKLSLIQKEFKAAKSKFNSFGKYNFRSAEDILEALKPFNEKYQVNFTITESIVESNFLQFPMLRSVASISDDLDTISASAIVGIDLDQKGMQMPQKFGSASSYGKKYALGNLLLIDDSQDADATNKHEKSTSKEELKWLNKNTPEFNKVVEYLKKGGNIAEVEKKYKISTEVKTELTK
tara:strand:+ start:1445 stop:1999 length:555 start_codon:yes stop_codon:yes gene_type:complete